jgi:hypothetical protein
MTVVKALHQSGRVRIAVVIMLGNDRVDDLEIMPTLPIGDMA